MLEAVDTCGPTLLELLEINERTFLCSFTATLGLQGKPQDDHVRSEQYAALSSYNCLDIMC